MGDNIRIRRPSFTINNPFSEEETRMFSEAFTNMNTYKKGTIHNSELFAFLDQIGIRNSPAQIELYTMFWRAQRLDDLIPLEDLMRIISLLYGVKQGPAEIALLFDKDGDGIISPEEFVCGISALAAYDPIKYGEMSMMSYNDVLNQADSNRDGKLQVQELEAWLSSNSN